MKLTRDSLVLWIGLALAVVGYLISAAKPPTEWSYMEYLQAASFVLAWAMGKLGSSPLPGAISAGESVTAKTLDKIAKSVPAVLLAVGLGLGVTSCASARHVAVQADRAFAATIFALDDAEYRACAEKALPADVCRAADAAIRQALSDVKALTLALQATPRTAAVPLTLPDLLTDLSTIQRILSPSVSVPGVSPPVQQVGIRLDAAIQATIDLLRQLAGGVQ